MRKQLLLLCVLVNVLINMSQTRLRLSIPQVITKTWDQSCLWKKMLLSAALWKYGVITGLTMYSNFCLYLNIRNHSTPITTKRNVIKEYIYIICAQRQHARMTDVHQIPTNCCCRYVWYDEDSHKWWHPLNSDTIKTWSFHKQGYCIEVQHYFTWPLNYS